MKVVLTLGLFRYELWKIVLKLSYAINYIPCIDSIDFFALSFIYIYMYVLQLNLPNDHL